MLQVKDKIYNFKQLHSEALYETWLRFKKKLKNSPNHRTTSRNLLGIIYRALNANTDVIVDTITSEACKSPCWDHASKIIDQNTKFNQRCHTREMNNLVDTYAIGTFSEQRALYDIVA